MKNVEHKRSSLLANLGDINRPLRVRPVRYMSREWWAVDSEDTWPGMVMDLRRLGFEAVALEDEVLVRESAPMYEPQMEGPNAPEGLKPFPVITPTITVHKESFLADLTDYTYQDRYGHADEREDEADLDADYEDEDVDELEDLDGEDE